MARCPDRKNGNHCWHQSDHKCWTVNPPINTWWETCCHCGKKRWAESRPTETGGHGPHGPPKYEYETTYEDAPDSIRVAGGRTIRGDQLLSLMDMIRRA